MENSTNLQGLEFSAFYGWLVLGEKFQGNLVKFLPKNWSLPEGTDLPPCLKHLCCTNSLPSLCNKYISVPLQLVLTVCIVINKPH